jgi:hypothetical protein
VTEFEKLHEGLCAIATAIGKHAEAMREIAAALRLPYEGPKHQAPVYGCEKCGSPNWKPGEAAYSIFKVCSDCGHIGDMIDES